ncbi:PilZ domain-containing protein [Treponema sp. R80B11-R83G3]
MIPFLILIALVLAGVVFVTNSSGEKKGSWIQFYAKGKEAGFSIKDMEQLRRLVSTCQINDPVSIFRSRSQFEKVIRSMVNTLHSSGEYNDQTIQYFLSKLFDYYNDIEMQTAEDKTRITSSRQITEGQALRVLVPGTGVYKSEVVKNSGNYLAISRPTNAKSSSNMEWLGLKLSVYFWREDDAGYVFDSEVIDEVFSKGISSLKIDQNDSLFRTQKRKSMRVKFRKPAFLYLVNDVDNPHRLEKAAGLKVMLEDISDTGCAFRVMGQVSTGMRFKAQFLLNKIPVCVPGTVRSVDYDKEKNISVVHMEADTLPIGTRNFILCEVFNLLPEDDEEELPFRVLEEEADAVSKQTDQVVEEKNE